MVWWHLLEAHQVHGFTYFDQVVKLWVCDGVVGPMEEHQVHGFTYFDQVVKFRVYDGVDCSLRSTPGPWIYLL